jgi:tRNA pseudouridine13 synthase
MISREFAKAAELLLAEQRGGEGERIAEARRLCREGNYGDALPLFSAAQDLERRVANHLFLKPGDHIGALRKIPVRIRRLLVNAYQALLFNLTLSRVITEGVDISSALFGDNWATLREDGLNPGKVHGAKESPPEGTSAIPLIQTVGYAYRNYGSRFDLRLAEILREEGIEARLFYVKEMEEISSEGGFRAAPLLASGLSFKQSNTGLELEFSLGKGEYATVLLRELLKPEDPLAEGF